MLSCFPEEVGKVECRLEDLERPSSPQMVVYVTSKIPVSSLLSGKSSFDVSEEVLARIDDLLYAHRLLTVRARPRQQPHFVPVDVAVNLAGAQNAAIKERTKVRGGGLSESSVRRRRWAGLAARAFLHARRTESNG